MKLGCESINGYMEIGNINSLISLFIWGLELEYFFIYIILIFCLAVIFVFFSVELEFWVKWI